MAPAQNKIRSLLTHFDAARLIGLITLGLGVMGSFSGCIFAAVHTARFIERKIDPPQPLLYGTGTFFDGSIKATVILRSTETRRRRSKLSSPEELPEGALTTEPESGRAKGRMALLTILSNTGASTLEVTALSVDSLLGQALLTSKPVALDDGQRLLLASFRSDREANLEALVVTVTLQRGEVVEKKEVTLAPFNRKEENAEDAG